MDPFGGAGRRLIAKPRPRLPNRDRRTVMRGDGGRIGSLLLQGSTPMLGAPFAGVGRIHADHREAAPGGHGDEPGAEPAGGDASHGAAQGLAAQAAT